MLAFSLKAILAPKFCCKFSSTPNVYNFKSCIRNVMIVTIRISYITLLSTIKRMVKTVCRLDTKKF